MFKEDHLSFRQRKYMKVKNIIGRALGGIGLVVLSPVYLAIIVAIKKEDGITAPVFFSQKRVGIHKEYFNLYKFRSMRTDTPHDKPTHLLENPDQYITKVGHFLRKSSLDELPQLWNIARGDMAVIGPRPALWNQDDLIAERDKYGANDVKPGLTGWAQINGRDELEIPVKARLDGEYVKKMGPLMDIRCFIGTVFSVLRSDGVVEGGTGAKKKLMVITNHSYMLWQFRRELIGKLMEDYDVIISTPFVGHEDDFKAMGCTMIETDVDRRGINPKTDMKLYLTYRRLLKEHHPDMVVTYSIKPNVYAGYACRQMRIPYCVNVQGLGTAFQKKALLKGVKAEDNRDGDLTSSVRIASMSHFIAPGKRTITYVVFDKANQAGTLERTVQYEDYTPPKIHLTAPLRYSTTELSKANLTENMTAEDCLDGDLTSQIRTSLDDGMYNAAAGIYKVTVQVSNSAGDVCSVPLEVTVTESGDRQEQMKEYPVLSDYIAYTTVGHEIDPMSYVKGMEMNGATYTYADDGEALAGTREAISVKSEVDYSKAGVYPVEYFYTAEGAPTAVTKLFVVVQDQEGAQDGE